MTLINSAQSALDALYDDDPGIRYHAAWWLGKQRVASAVPHLVRCLTDDRDKTSSGGFPLRRQAARSLGLIRDPSCTSALLKTLESDDVQLHEATLRALMQFESSECINKLSIYLDEKINNKPIEALIEALTIHKAWHLKEKLKPFLNSNSERVRSACAAYFFECTGEEEYLHAILTNLKHQNRFIRQSAAFDLARLSTISCIDHILSAELPNNVKLFSLKSILCTNLDNNKTAHASKEYQKILDKLDSLVRENISGNLLNEKQSADAQKHYPSPSEAPTSTDIMDAFTLLKSSSLEEKEQGVKLLAKREEIPNNTLADIYFKESDQDVKIGLIKAITLSGRTTSLPALLDAIGVEIGNHCQGNIRRIAATGLGKIGHNELASSNSHTLQLIFSKLNWTIKHPDDWGLRYAACLSLEEIGDSQAEKLLKQADGDEADTAVSMRIKQACQKLQKIHYSQS